MNVHSVITVRDVIAIAVAVGALVIGIALWLAYAATDHRKK